MHGIGLNIDLTNSRFLIYGAILVAMMLFRPEGLIPSRQRKAELHAADSDVDAAQAEQELYLEAPH
jgi:branched-chain amino acid transport system permease protein